jgi:phosphatidylglycerol---prolipoprotein diacylglyceryl transferase
VHPVLFWLPLAHLPVYSYGFMLGLAMVLGWNLAIYLAWRDGVCVTRMATAGLAVAVFALVGARVLHVLVNPAELARPGSWLDMRGGIVAYGGFLGGALGAYIFLGRGGIGFLRAADLLALPVALGIFLTRVGCFLNGCDFGTPTTLPWGVRFPRDRGLDATWNPGPSPAWREHLAGGASLGGETVTMASPWSLPVHPTQLYESLLGLLLFATLVYLWRRRSSRGLLFLVLCAAYGVARAVIECFRGDVQRGIVMGLSTSQFLGLSTALLALAASFTLHRRRAATTGGCAPWSARRPAA